jgi:hypothetical protein
MAINGRSPATGNSFVIQTAGMSWTPQDRMYSTEASDIGWRAGFWPRTWILLGQHTDRRLTMRFADQDAGGRWVDYRPTNPRYDFIVRIYND